MFGLIRGPSSGEREKKGFALVSVVFTKLRLGAAIWSAGIIAKLAGKKY